MDEQRLALALAIGNRIKTQARGMTPGLPIAPKIPQTLPLQPAIPAIKPITVTAGIRVPTMDEITPIQNLAKIIPPVEERGFGEPPLTEREAAGIQEFGEPYPSPEVVGARAKAGALEIVGAPFRPFEAQYQKLYQFTKGNQDKIQPFVRDQNMRIAEAQAMLPEVFGRDKLVEDAWGKTADLLGWTPAEKTVFGLGAFIAEAVLAPGGMAIGGGAVKGTALTAIEKAQRLSEQFGVTIGKAAEWVRTGKMPGEVLTAWEKFATKVSQGAGKVEKGIAESMGAIRGPAGREFETGMARVRKTIPAIQQKTIIINIKELEGVGTNLPVSHAAIERARDITKVEPIIISKNSDGSIRMIDGSHRLSAMKAAGHKEIPVIIEQGGKLPAGEVKPAATIGEIRTEMPPVSVKPAAGIGDRKLVDKLHINKTEQNEGIVASFIEKYGDAIKDGRIKNGEELSKVIFKTDGNEYHNVVQGAIATKAENQIISPRDSAVSTFNRVVRDIKESATTPEIGILRQAETIKTPETGIIPMTPGNKLENIKLAEYEKQLGRKATLEEKLAYLEQQRTAGAGGKIPPIEKPPVPMPEPGPELPKKQLNAVDTIIKTLKEAKPLRGKQEAIYTVERAKKIARAAAMGETIPGEQGFYAQLGQLKGRLPKVEFETLRGKITQGHIDELFDTVQKSSITEFEKINAKSALSKLLGAEGGTVPTRNEITLLSEIFPSEFIQTVLDKRPAISKLWELGENALNLPRAMMATADFSAPLRQGIFLAAGHPVRFARAFKDMFKYAFSEKAYQGFMDSVKLRPTYKIMREAGLPLTDMGVSLTGREEVFMSNWAEKIPGFGRIAKGSNRAYTGFLNKLRADVFDDLYRTAKQTGILESRPDVIKDIAKYVGSATGRGDIGALNKAATTLNAVFFSPRLMASRLNLLNPVYYVKLDPLVRKAALKDLLLFTGSGISILELAKLGGADISFDPRNTDFLKIKIGDTRYDPWGGFQQYLVLGGRLLSGQMVSSTTGKEFNLGEGYKPTTRFDIIGRFLTSKTNPVVSFAIGLAKGEAAMGGKFNIPAEVIDRFIPMVIQDATDLIKEKGAIGLPMVTPGLFGVGVQTYADKIPIKKITPAGKETVQWRPGTGLGEDIINKILGSRPSDIPESEWAKLKDIKSLLDIQNENQKITKERVDNAVKLINKLPQELRTKYILQIGKNNPEIFRKLLTALREERKGLTYSDSLIRQLSAETGQRAEYIHNQVSKLPPDKQREYLLELTRKGLMTNDVWSQMIKLKQGNQPLKEAK